MKTTLDCSTIRRTLLTLAKMTTHHSDNPPRATDLWERQPWQELVHRLVDAQTASITNTTITITAS
jgi:hypothetical protein